MSDTLLAIVIFLVFVAGPFSLIFLMDRRLKSRGPMFSGPASLRLRVLALLLGIFFAGWFFVELTAGAVDFLPIILAIALISYGFGGGQWLRDLQGEATESAGIERREETVVNAAGLRSRPVRLGAVLLFIVLVLIGGSFLAVNPKVAKPVVTVFVLGFFLYWLRGWFSGWYWFLRNLFK